MKHIKVVSFIVICIFALSCILFLPKVRGDVIKSKYFNYVEKGGRTVRTSPSTQYKLMETYPEATVTVYEAGTTDLASLWVDRDGLIIKANPFIANTDSYYEFYVDCGKYDIKFSGTGISVPYTFGDIFICGSIGGSEANNFFVGTAGTDFNVNISGSDITYNLPDASLVNRGAVTTIAQSFNGDKTFDDNVIIDSAALQFTGSTSGLITIRPAAIAGTYSLTLPINDGDPSQVLQTDGNGILSWATVGGGGSGTVTNFSSGNLVPLFTTSVANSTTTPTLSFILSNAGANTYFGNNTGDSAAPSFITLSAISPIVISQGAGTTTLSCPTCGGGTLINPTDSFIPYRSNATTFLDAMLSRHDANTLIARKSSGSGVGSTQVFVVAREYASSISWHGLAMQCSSVSCDLVVRNNTGSIVSPELNIGTGSQINFFTSGSQRWRFTTAGDFIPSGSNSGFSIGDSTHVVNTQHMWKQIKFYNQSGQNLTTSTPFIDHEVTWDNVGVTFINFKSNITDGASAVGSLLMDLQVDGVSKFKIRKDGMVTIAGSLNVSSNCYATDVCDFFGSGSPEGVLSANVGSTYRRTDGGASTSFYVKESGTGNTGWIAK